MPKPKQMVGLLSFDDLDRMDAEGQLAPPASHYYDGKYTERDSLEACLWLALHQRPVVAVPWQHISPEVTDEVLSEMVARGLLDGGFSGGCHPQTGERLWGWSVGSKKGKCFAAFPSSMGCQAAWELTYRPRPHDDLYTGKRLVDLVRRVLWTPVASPLPDAALLLARQELVRTLASVVERKENEQQQEMQSMLLGALVRTETEYVTVEERRDWWRQCCPGFLHGIDKPFLERGGKRFVIGGTGSGPCEGGTEETFYCYEVVPEAEWPHPKCNLLEMLHDRNRAGNWQGLRTCRFTVSGRGKRVEGDAFVLTGYVLKLVLPPGEFARMLAEDKAKFWAKHNAETEPVPAPAPEPVPEPVTSCLPPAPLTAGGLTCTTYDAAGNHAMLSFAHAVKAAGYSDRITTGGELDAKKCCRACNALCGRVASDRPQPSVGEWFAAAKFVKVSSGDGFDEIDALDALPKD